MKTYKILLSLLLTFGIITGCEKEKDLLNQTNPNSSVPESFWKNEKDAISALNAAYSNIQTPGITRWELFQYDMRSDEGYSQSPWTDLGNVGKFIFNDYNIAFIQDIWRECYRGIFRANQILKYVPDIAMDPVLKKRILAEATFIRGHLYFKLVTLWGRVPLVTEIKAPNDRPKQGTIEQGWAQVIADFSAAKADLPLQYTGNDVGRATKGAAMAYLGKAYLQQHKYTEAAAQFKEIIDLVPARYDLIPNFKDNFTEDFENNQESIFEIQYISQNKSGTPSYDIAGGSGSESSERAQFFGVRNVGWCDGQVTKKLYNEFMKEKDKDNKVDPRLGYTMFYDHPGELMYGKPYGHADRPFGPNDRFWKKYTNYWKDTDSYFSGINDRRIRLADVYLMYAECLNELGQTPQAIPFANKVRARSNMKDLELDMNQSAFREQLRHDRIVELAGESVRFLDMMRYGILGPELAGTDPGNTPANESDYDTEFKYFVKNKSEYLPIPLYELDANKELKQNLGW
ncbi:MAG: RagB/SusD family nutrient uptake outer membrane protein [Bacteroidota bacterium]